MTGWPNDLQKLINYIDEHAVENPSLDEIAAQIGYSPSHCSEQFHKLSGITIRSYMSKRRIFSAAEFLRETDRPIMDIALECGFSSQQALSCAFRKAFGCSPRAYRMAPSEYSSNVLKEVSIVLEFRKVFDSIPELFDKYRPRYTPELFSDLIAYANITENSTVLEMGPGTGQATDPILNTGCDYNAIEIGENLAAKMVEKYGDRENFHLTVGDFITHDFEERKFDLIYSAATIQWIPEEVAFRKTFDLLKPGGVLAMMSTQGNYRTSNPELYEKIQKVYRAHFRPAIEYPHRNFKYSNAVKYGYVDYEERTFPLVRVFDAENYVNYVKTHSDHIVIPEPHRTPFFEGLYKTVKENGDRVEYNDTCILRLARKPFAE